MKHPKKLTWLVVSTPLKNTKVSWDNQIPKIWKNKSHVPNHQPVTLLRPKKTSCAPHICTYWDRGSSPVGRNNSTSPGSDTCELGSVTGKKTAGG